MAEVSRYDGILRPDPADQKKLEWLKNGVIVSDNGRSEFAGEYEQIPQGLREQVNNAPIQNGVAIPPTLNAHQHAFQPRWSRAELIVQDKLTQEIRGSLMPALRSETLIRNNTDTATEIAHELCDDMIENGIAEAVIYTTSSIEALANMLKVMCERGFEGRVKLGYVFMNQNMDEFMGKPIPGVNLELKSQDEDAVFAELEKLSKKYPGMLTMIDRFPIAVNSTLRRKIVEFCSETGLDYDTHIDESENEAGFTASLYEGRRIIKVLEDDGVFTLNKENQTVRLAHGILTNDADFEILKMAKESGCNIEVVACPSSNLNIRSQWINNPSTGERDQYVAFPFKKWSQVATVRFGIDAGAGVTKSMFAEAASAVIRDSAGAVTWTDAYHAIRAPRAILQTGGSADWLHVQPDQVSLLQQITPSLSVDELIAEIAKSVMIGAGGNGGIKAMYLDGKQMKPRPSEDRPRLSV